MKPLLVLGQTTTPDGKAVVLSERGGDYFLLVNGQVLMNSRDHRSEEAMAEPLGVLANQPGCRVLIGGLGMGFTLRAALDVLPSDAEVVVVELLPEVVTWNREVLGQLARHPLRDPRAAVRSGDVVDVLRSGEKFDAVLLDVDNGPSAFTTASNGRLYGRTGGDLIRAALRPEGPGLLVLWSASEGSGKQPVLDGFTTESRALRTDGRTHVLHIARRGRLSRTGRPSSGARPAAAASRAPRRAPGSPRRRRSGPTCDPR
jgi:spermidine synthase